MTARLSPPSVAATVKIHHPEPPAWPLPCPLCGERVLTRTDGTALHCSNRDCQDLKVAVGVRALGGFFQVLAHRARIGELARRALASVRSVDDGSSWDEADVKSAIDELTQLALEGLRCC